MLPFPSPGDLPNSGIEPTAPTLTGRLFTAEPTGKPTKRLISLKLPNFSTTTPPTPASVQIPQQDTDLIKREKDLASEEKLCWAECRYSLGIRGSWKWEFLKLFPQLNALWWPKWKGNLKRAYMYTCSWFTTQHLSSNYMPIQIFFFLPIQIFFKKKSCSHPRACAGSEFGGCQNQERADATMGLRMEKQASWYNIGEKSEVFYLGSKSRCPRSGWGCPGLAEALIWP